MRARLGRAPSRMQLQRPSCLRLVFHRGSLGSALWSGNTSGRWHFFEEAQGQGGKSNNFSELGLLFCTLFFPSWRRSKGKNEV